MIHVRADLVGGFKRCCMLSGDLDGSDRDYFFPVVRGGVRRQLDAPRTGIELELR